MSFYKIRGKLPFGHKKHVLPENVFVEDFSFLQTYFTFFLVILSTSLPFSPRICIPGQYRHAKTFLSVRSAPF